MIVQQEHYSPPQSGAVKGVAKPQEGNPTEGGSGDKCGEGGPVKTMDEKRL